MKEAKLVERIALLTDGVHPLVLGGMQKHSYYLLKNLIARGIEVLVYHPGGKDKLISHLPEEHCSRMEEVIIPFPTNRGMPGTYLRNSYKYALAIADDLAVREPVQFIYAQGFTGWAIADRKRKGQQLPPLGVNFHGLEMFQQANGIKQKLIQHMFRGPVKFNLLHADRVYSLGGKLTSILEKIVPKEKVVVIPIAIEEDWILQRDKSFPEAILRVLFIGRYERRKGIEELNQHMASTAGENDVEYHFIGPIPPSKQIQDSRVIYHGKVMDSGRMMELIDMCHALVVPSTSEGMPTVILEAMARGLIILATDVGAVSEEVDDQNGWLMPDNSSKSIAAGLHYLRSLTPEEKLMKSAESRKRVIERFLWSHVIDLTIAEFQD